MATYLKYINPVVAILIFLLCFYAATTDGGTPEPGAILEGAMSTYFFAKGIFCGLSVFLLGKILEVMLANTK